VTGPLPTLPAFPANAAVPTPAQRLAIDAALNQADLLIAAFLGAGNRDAYLDAVFGNAQRAAALANFQAMRQVVGRWQNQTRDVYVSAWLTRFNRGRRPRGSPPTRWPASIASTTGRGTTPPTDRSPAGSPLTSSGRLPACPACCV